MIFTNDSAYEINLVKTQIPEIKTIKFIFNTCKFRFTI